MGQYLRNASDEESRAMAKRDCDSSDAAMEREGADDEFDSGIGISMER